MGIESFSKTNRRNINGQILLFPQDLDFGWVAKWQPVRVGTFVTLISRQHPSKTVLLCESWCCVSIATISRSSSLNCCKTEEKHAHGINDTPRRWWNVFGRRTVLVLVWFPRELTDVVMFLHSTQTCKPSWNKRCSTQVKSTIDISTQIACAIRRRCSI